MTIATTELIIDCLIDRLFHHQLRQHRKIRKKKKAIERRDQREKETKNQRMNKVNGEETKRKIQLPKPCNRSPIVRESEEDEEPEEEDRECEGRDGGPGGGGVEKEDNSSLALERD